MEDTVSTSRGDCVFPVPDAGRRQATGWGTLLLFHLRLFLSTVRRRWIDAGTGQAGTSTAEYAIATLAAVAFAGLLVVIMRSDEVRGFLLAIIRTALAIP
ncbi:DUF4244 domain-containing protein [Arthrobacter sp. NPDC090010]|uniref:DUF4244 domain-containing protein n=1 Tax=Arthrobacter sp. NPDC090010 TaxID=3363942 RepID=UPI0038159CE4